jgi:3-deoxy-D-manno-octulosonic acid kinase
VRRFHDAGVWHADLTAHNLQINAAGEIFLLDFDRGRRRDAGAGWRQGNLARLRRSLDKISSAGQVHFDDAGWRALQAGYAGSFTRTGPAAAAGGP